MPISTSQRSVLSTRRTSPRWCDHHTYSSDQPSSLARTAAISFSMPSRFSFEKGMLFGSPQTRSAFCCASPALALRPRGRRADASATTTAALCQRGARRPATRWPATLRLDRKDIEHATLGGGFVQTRLVGDAHCTQCSVRILAREIVRDGQTEPTAHAGVDRHVLLLVRALERHRVADDPGRHLVLPEHLARLGIYGLEPAVHRSVEDEIRGGGQHAAPGGEALLDPPLLLARDGIPRHQLTQVAAGPWLHRHVGTHVRGTRHVLHLGALV